MKDPYCFLCRVEDAGGAVGFIYGVSCALAAGHGIKRIVEGELCAGCSPRLQEVLDAAAKLNEQHMKDVRGAKPQFDA